jgi:catechol 2,3-dioxygenase-like lactoylglutathione lyase family enzyme
MEKSMKDKASAHAAIKVKRMDHVAVMVSDLDRSYAFYHDLLGLEQRDYVAHHMSGVSEMTGVPNGSIREYRMGLPANPGLTIDLIEWLTPRSPTGRYHITHVPSAHLCFDVDDIDATYEFLKAHGVEFVSPPVHWPKEEGGWVVLFFYDPDGNLLELNQPQR